MARRKVADPVTITTWAEADKLLGQLAAREREIKRIQLDLDARVAVLKDNAQLVIREHQASIKTSKKALERFANQHKEEFGKARSKRLTHGTIGWQATITTKILTTPKKVVEKLIAIGRLECLTQKEPTIDKIAVRRLTESEQARVGIQVVTKDEFVCRTEADELPEVVEE